jgi:hypothetical protein
VCPRTRASTLRSSGRAENALRALLERTLAGTDLAYRHWVALSVIAGSETPVDDLRTAGTVLTLITERADEALAGS